MPRASKVAAIATAALSALLYVAPEAEADMMLGAKVHATFVSQGPNGGNDVSVHLAGDGSFRLSQGGAMDYKFVSGTNPLPNNSTFANPFEDMNGNVNANGAFNTFCIEITQNIGFGQTYEYTVSDLAKAPQPHFESTTPVDGMGSTAATEIAQLWAHYFPTIGTDSNTAAAFQLAIWKLEYDQSQIQPSGTFSASLFNSGNLTATESSGLILNAAANMIQWVEDHPNAVEQANLYALISGTNQDQIAQVPGNGGQQVPEPATALMCLMGCVCVGAQRLRRMNWRRSTIV